MNNVKKAAWGLLLLPALALASCEQNSATTAETPAASTETPAPADAEALPAATAAYVCPMGCEGSASDQPGQCPVCKMDLEPNPAATPSTTL